MPSKARGVRVPEVLEREIQREADQRGKSWSATTMELLTESLRMRRVPGIAFVDGTSGRRAVIAGTGLDVWEIIAAWKAGNESFRGLKDNYPWLTEEQLRVALGYYELFPQEIEARLERERWWTPERLRQELPFAVLKKGPFKAEVQRS
ncbi:MAG: DUF433 domain-containing protein [Deinococcota bacterium]|jgi:uncharacterized protein (DUF433 family)|nr:DUF433 domain-containing protein [Deinococcota bacterium]